MSTPSAPSTPTLTEPSGCCTAVGSVSINSVVNPFLDDHGNGNCVPSAVSVNGQTTGPCNGASCTGCAHGALPFPWVSVSAPCQFVDVTVDLDAARQAGVAQVTVIIYAGGTDAFGHNPTGNVMETQASLNGGPPQTVSHPIPESSLHDSNFSDFCWSSLGLGVACTCVIDTATGAFVLS